MQQSDIKKWVEDNASGLMPYTSFAPDEIKHIAMCMHHIYRWYYEGYPLGDFLAAVVRNDFREACIQADDTNRKALYLYAMFVLNKIPFDYIEKANKKKGR